MMPRSLSVRCTDNPRKPLQPTSTGSDWALQPLSLQVSTSSRYLVFFLYWAFSSRSSLCTLSFSSVSCLVELDVRTRSAYHCYVLWKRTCLLRSMKNCQSRALASSTVEALHPLSPLLVKARLCFTGTWCLHCLVLVQMASDPDHGVMYAFLLPELKGSNPRCDPGSPMTSTASILVFLLSLHNLL